MSKYIQLGAKADERDNRIIRNDFKSVIFVQLHHSWDKSLSLWDAWKQFWYQLWSATDQYRLNDTIGNTIKNIPCGLSKSLQKSIAANNWHDNIIKIFNWKNATQKHRFKHFLHDAIVKSAIAAYSLITTEVMFEMEIRKEHNRVPFWTSHLTVLVILTSLSVWSQVFHHFWKPRKFINWQQTVDSSAIAMELFYVGFSSVFHFHEPNKFDSFERFIKSVLPCEYYSYPTGWHNFYLPEAFIKPAIIEFQYNKNNHNPKHWTTKITPYSGHVLTWLFEKHYDLLVKCFDSAKFSCGNDFNSSCMNKKTVGNGINTIWCSYKRKRNLYVNLTIAETDSLMASLKTMDNGFMTPMFDPQVIPISKFTADFSDTCM